MNKKINEKGVFITFMVFLLIASVLALHSVTKRTDIRQERKDIEGAAFNVVNNAFNNMYEELISLNKEGYAKTVQQRPMPFQYNFNRNGIILTQRLPIRGSALKAYVDALNIYSIFTNSEQGKADLNIVTTTLQDSQWNSEAPEYPDLNYVILPQCLLYDVNGCCFDTNIMVLREFEDAESGCQDGFDYADLNVVDINISINSTGCNSGGISGNLSGKAEGGVPGPEAFDPNETRPYLKITINETNAQCPGTDCYITDADGKTVVSTHFDPEDYPPPDTVIESLRVQCGPNDWVRVKVGKDSEEDPFPLAIYNWLFNKPFYVDLNMTFDQKVDLFYFTGFSISVEKKNFAIKRSS